MKDSDLLSRRNSVRACVPRAADGSQVCASPVILTERHPFRPRRALQCKRVVAKASQTDVTNAAPTQMAPTALSTPERVSQTPHEADSTATPTNALRHGNRRNVQPHSRPSTNRCRVLMRAAGVLWTVIEVVAAVRDRVHCGAAAVDLACGGALASGRVGFRGVRAWLLAAIG